MRYVCVILLLAACLPCLAQVNVNVGVTLPQVALVDILTTSSTNVSLNLTAPTEAGNTPGTGSTNSANWLVFTSAVASGGSRSIKGEVLGTMPPGLRLRLDVSGYVGSGLGFTGGESYVTANRYLTGTPTSFIDNIKGAYTGITAGSSGFKLTYSIEIQTFSNIRSGTSNLTVRYTMADN